MAELDFWLINMESRLRFVDSFEDAYGLLTEMSKEFELSMFGSFAVLLTDLFIELMFLGLEFLFWNMLDSLLDANKLTWLLLNFDPWLLTYFLTEFDGICSLENLAKANSLTLLLMVKACLFGDFFRIFL